MKTKLMLMAVAVAVAFGAWAETEYANGYTWIYRIIGSTAEISAITPSSTGAVTIPSTLGGKLVTSIESFAFYNCSDLTSVTIPDSVTRIWFSTFRNCIGLTSVTIPNGVTSIGSSTLTPTTMNGSSRGIARRLSISFPERRFPNSRGASTAS